MKNKIMSLALICVVIVSVFLPVTYANQSVLVSPQLITYFEGLYTNPNAAEVTDKDGADITIQFFNSTSQFYKNHDFAAIKEYVNCHVGTLAYSEYRLETPSGTSLFALNRPMTVTKHCVRLLPSAGILTGFYVIFDLSGAFYYNPNTGLVTSVSSSSISNINYEDKPAGLSAAPSNFAYNQVVSGNRVTFYGSFRLVAYSSPNHVELVNNYGTISDSVIGVAP